MAFQNAISQENQAHDTRACARNVAAVLVSCAWVPCDQMDELFTGCRLSLLLVTQASSSDGKKDCVTSRKEQLCDVVRFISIFTTFHEININNSNYKKKSFHFSKAGLNKMYMFN